MGKRTLRAIHFNLVARVLRERAELADMGQGDIWTIAAIARQFADEFESRAEGFQRAKFYAECGLTVDVFRGIR